MVIAHCSNVWGKTIQDIGAFCYCESYPPESQVFVKLSRRLMPGCLLGLKAEGGHVLLACISTQWYKEKGRQLLYSFLLWKAVPVFNGGCRVLTLLYSAWVFGFGASRKQKLRWKLLGKGQFIICRGFVVICQGQWRIQISFFFNLSSVMAAPWRELAENRRRQVNCICIYRNLEVYQLLWLWNADLAIPEPERTAPAFGTGQVLNVFRFRTEAPFPLQEDKK